MMSPGSYTVPTLVFQEGSGNLMPHRLIRFHPKEYSGMHADQLKADLSKMHTPEPVTVDCEEYMHTAYYYNQYDNDTVLSMLSPWCHFIYDLSDANTYWQYKLPRVAQCYLDLKVGCAPWQCIRVRQPRNLVCLMLGKPWVTMSLVKWCITHAPVPFTPEDTMLKAIYEQLVKMAGVPVDTFKFNIEENLDGKAKLIIDIYTNVPANGCSCGSGGDNTAYPSVNGSCMHKQVDEFDGSSMMEGKHPCAAYASADIGIAWLTNDANETVGRALLNPADKHHSRVYRYADETCSDKATYAQSVEERLRSELKNLGYSHSNYALSGCKLNLSTQRLRTGEHWVLPYLDGNAVRCDSSTGIISTSYGDLLCQEHNPPIVPEMEKETNTADMYRCTMCGDYFDESFVNEDSQGEYCCHNCQDNYFLCAHCDMWVSTDDSYSHADYSYCERCWSRDYFLCDSCGESTSFDEQVCVTGGDGLCESCAEDYNMCHLCDELFPPDDTHVDPIDPDKSLCNSCYDEHWHECAECSNVISKKESLCYECTPLTEAILEATTNA